MTATISVSPCPSVRDFKHEGWARLVRCKEFFLITFVWIGWISRYVLSVRGEALPLLKSRHVGMYYVESKMVANTASFQLTSGTAEARPCSQAGL
eukprot:1160591-Pelagomonas_calceolata.AAC.1